MSSELLIACNCIPCCKCHPAVGGATSISVQWTGSASITSATCCAWESTCSSGTAGTVYLYNGSGGKSVGPHTYVATWNNALNQLDCRIKNEVKSDGQGTYNEYEYVVAETPPGSGIYVTTCVGPTGYSATFGASFAATITVLPPTASPCAGCASVTGWQYPRKWTVIVAVAGIVRWTFVSDSSDCSDYGYFSLSSEELLYSSIAGSCTGGCGAILWGSGAWQLGTLNSGTVVLS